LEWVLLLVLLVFFALIIFEKPMKTYFSLYGGGDKKNRGCLSKWKKGDDEVLV